MKLVYTIFCLISVGCLILGSSGGRDDERSGAPPSNLYCNSCHTGSGSGMIALTGGPAGGIYVNNQVYNLTLTLSDASAVVGGFQITALNSSNAKIGTFTQGSGSRTSANMGLTHSTPKPFSGGSVSWTFTWTAPSSGSSPVTFYFAGNAANGNGNDDSGDKAYRSNTLCTPPSISITGETQICPGSSTTLTASGADTYTWAPGGETAPSITVTPPSQTTYTVTGIRTSDMCAGTASVTVFIRQRPTVTLAPTHVTCNGAGDGSIQTTPGGSSPFTFNWSNGSSSQNLSNLQPGTYTVTVTDSHSCTQTASTTITQPAVLSASANPTSGTVCPGSTITITVSATGGTSPYTGTGPFQVGPGTHVFDVTDANGCTASTSVTITQSSTVPVSITGTTGFCPGSSTTLSTTPTFISYQWSTGSNSPSITVNSQGTYSVTVTNSQGCTGSSSTSVIQFPTPTPTITGSGQICQNGSTSLSVTQTYQSYRWSHGPTTKAVTISTAGTYTVTVTDGNGCTGTTSKVVTVLPAPVFSITGSTTFCTGSFTTLSVQPAFAAYHWSNDSTTQSIKVTTEGTYTVTITDASTCTATQPVTVTESDGLNPNIGGPSVICNNPVTLDAGAGFANYLWSNGDTTQTITTSTPNTYCVTVSDAGGCSGSTCKTVTAGVAPTCLIPLDSVDICLGSGYTITLTSHDCATYSWGTSQTSADITVNPTATTDYRLTVTSSDGCSATDVIRIYVRNPVVDLGTDSLFYCYTDNINYKAPDGFAKYQWSNGSSSQTITPANPGRYTLTVTDQYECTDSDSINFVRYDSISAGFEVVDSCITATATGGVSPYLYNWSTGSNSPTACFGASGTYCVTIVDAEGCTKTVCTDYTRIATKNPLSPATVSLYPNPANDILYINTTGIPVYKIEVFDGTGRKVSTPDLQKSGEHSYMLDTRLFVTGNYFIKILSKEQSVVQRFIIMK